MPARQTEPLAAATSATIDTVEVLSQRETLRKAAQAFVASITRRDGDDVARWRIPICSVVSGATPELNEFVRLRILAVAKTAGAPITADPACRPNLLVVLSEQPEEMLTSLRTRKLQLIGTGLPTSVPALPVRIWRRAVLNNADGTGPREAVEKLPEYRGENSRIFSGVAEDITAAVVLVDTAHTGTTSFGQLADFLAMVSLARIDLEADLADSSTILRLFAPEAQAVPAGLTDWDRAFLKGLYASREALLHQRSHIASSMARDLAP